MIKNYLPNEFNKLISSVENREDCQIQTEKGSLFLSTTYLEKQFMYRLDFRNERDLLINRCYFASSTELQKLASYYIGIM